MHERIVTIAYTMMDAQKIQCHPNFLQDSVPHEGFAVATMDSLKFVLIMSLLDLTAILFKLSHAHKARKCSASRPGSVRMVFKRGQLPGQQPWRG